MLHHSERNLIAKPEEEEEEVVEEELSIQPAVHVGVYCLKATWDRKYAVF